MITGILRKPPYEHMISLCASTWQQLAAWHMAMLVFFMVAIVVSIPFWTRLLQLSKVQRAVVFGGLHEFWDISVIFWTSKVDCCCCFMIISYHIHVFLVGWSPLGWNAVIPNGWSLEIKDQESPFRCGEAWPRPAISHHHSYWTWWFIVDLPIENGDFP